VSVFVLGPLQATPRQLITQLERLGYTVQEQVFVGEGRNLLVIS